MRIQSDFTWTPRVWRALGVWRMPIPGDFTLDTTGLAGVGGVAYADSGDFTWIPRAWRAWAAWLMPDSSDFTLDTTGLAGVGGVAYADSRTSPWIRRAWRAWAVWRIRRFGGLHPGYDGLGGRRRRGVCRFSDFTLDTTGLAGVGGVAYADSADFTLNTWRV